MKAQVADLTGLQDAVRAINNLATAQVRKETPSLIGAKGIDRPKGVIKESDMMLEWSAEQAAEITQERIDPEFLPTSTNLVGGVHNLEFLLQPDAQVTREANDIVAKKVEFAAHDHFPWTVLSVGTPRRN